MGQKRSNHWGKDIGKTCSVDCPVHVLEILPLPFSDMEFDNLTVAFTPVKGTVDKFSRW